MAEFKLSIDAGDGRLVPVTVEAATVEEAARKASEQRELILQAASAPPPPASFDQRFAGEPAPPATDMMAPLAKQKLEAGLIEQAEGMGRPTPAQSFLIGGGQGAALGSWLDEITGALGATFSKLPGESWSDAFERHQRSAQRGIRSSETINPKSHLAGQAVGVGATLPIGFEAAAAGAVPAAAQGAARLAAQRSAAVATGAVTGAVSGAGEGETPEQRAINAGIGTVGGAAMGTIAPEMGRAVSEYVDAAKRGVGYVRSAIGLGARPQAERAVERGLHAAGVDPARARQMLEEARLNGQDLTLGDIGGTATGREARAAANMSPTAQAELQSFTGPRASLDERVVRARNFIDNLGTRGETLDVRQANKVAGGLENSRNYNIAYSSPGADAVWTPTLENFTRSDTGRRAIARAISEGTDIAATQGHRAPVQPFEVQPDGTLTPRVRQDGSTIQPSLQFWDYVKRSLGNMQREAPPGSDRARVLNDLGRQVRGELDRAVPAYQATRNVALEYFGHDNALDAGRDLLRKGVSAEETQRTRRMVMRLSPADRQLLESGYLDAVYQKLGDPTSGDPTRGVFGSVNQRHAAEAVLGAQRAERLANYLEAERLMTAFHGQVAGGPSTARQGFDIAKSYGGLGTLGVAGGAASSLYQMNKGDDAADTTARTAAYAAGGLAAGAGLAGMRGAQAGRLATLLTSRDPAVQNRVLRALTTSPALRREAAKILARVGGQAAADQGQELQQ